MPNQKAIQEQWLQRVGVWHDSGLSQKVWSRGVKPSQPGYWKKKRWTGKIPASPSNNSSAFVPVSLIQTQDWIVEAGTTSAQTYSDSGKREPAPHTASGLTRSVVGTSVAFHPGCEVSSGICT